MASKYRKIWYRKPKPWPQKILILEPYYSSHEYSPGHYRVTAQEWAVDYLTNGEYIVGGFHRVKSNVEVCDEIESLVKEIGLCVVVGCGMDCILRLLSVSSQFYGRGFRGFSLCLSIERCFCEIRRGKERIVFCDIRNWLSGDLPGISNWVGIDLPNVARWWPDDGKPELYHTMALEAMCRALAKWRVWSEKVGLLGFSYSMSAAAWGYWSRQGECRPVQRAWDSRIEAFERAAYYGGFCMAHRLGSHNHGPYYLLDFGGLYASVMARVNLPYRYFTIRRHARSGDLDRVQREGEALVLGRFRLDNGFLPTRTGFWVDWSHGPVECWLPWPEVCWIREHGKIEEVYSIIVYHVGPCLQSTAKHFLDVRYSEKRAGNNYEAKLAKLAINSIYGKCAQRFGRALREEALEDERDGIESFYHVQSKRSWQVAVFCGTKICTPADGGGDSSVPSLSAWITSWGRVELWRVCSQAGWENVLYNDTDSLIVNQAGFERLEDQVQDDVPGKLALKDRADSVLINGRKQYVIGDHHVDGGVPNMAVLDGMGGLVWVQREVYNRMVREDPDSVLTCVRSARAWSDEGQNLKLESGGYVDGKLLQRLKAAIASGHGCRESEGSPGITQNLGGNATSSVGAALACDSA